MIPAAVLALVYVAGGLVSLVVLYATIRLAATHALNSHAVWVYEDGVAKAIAKREADLTPAELALRARAVDNAKAVRDEPHGAADDDTRL